MKTSVNWLKEYIKFDCSMQQLSDDLSLAGLEVEAIHALNKIDERIVVGKILSRNPHPDADKLSVCEVTTGSETLQIVCGAPNCDAGNKVPVAQIGTVFDNGAFVIKKGKLRGVESHGMLCSARELGLGNDHDGLMILNEKYEVGKPLQDYFEFDYMVETEVTPNRPDWLSQIGIARELAAITNSTYTKPTVTLTQTDINVQTLASVTVDDSSLCPRYTARVIKNVKIGPSPKWMQKYLIAVGLRPINNVVDITNFVLLDCGQPLHAFDYDKVSGHTIKVRRANDGEKMPLLNGNEYTLSSEMLVIADADKPIALAGIMGGGNSEIDDSTVNVLLESAAFDASNIRATANSLTVNSDSSYRFQRGVDIEMVEFASARAAELICKYAGGELASGMIDIYPNIYTPHEVSCRFEKVNSVIGVDISPDKVKEIFTRLELPVIQLDNEKCTVAIPSFRLDLTREIDLIEEIARIYGLNNIPATPISGRIGGTIESDTYIPIQKMRDQLLSLGLDECYNYSLVNAQTAIKNTGFTEDDLVVLSNPLSAELSAMRPSLLPGMLQVVAHNINHKNYNLDLFELGRVISKKYDQEENYEVCIAITGLVNSERFANEKKVAKDFYDLKGIVEGLLVDRRIANFSFKAFEHPFFEIGQTASIIVNGRQIGVLGQVNSCLTGKMRTQFPIFMAYFNADTMLKVLPKKSIHEELPTTPATSRDISFVANKSLSHEEI
ncbi:MAG: phenylalanine--tRNA ligase subunit beta, partial [Lentisphaeria bacterium]